MGKKVIRGGLIIKATLASGSGDDLLTIDATTGEVGKISGTPLTTTLTAGSIFLGNASNVATATAMSGDVTINSSGVTAIGSGVIVNADVNASAAIAHSKMAALTDSRALVSDGSGVVSVSAVTSTELGYVSGVTSPIQTQFAGKQATITGAATTITSSDLTVNKALVSNASGKVGVSTITSTELGYLSGVSSNIQTQFSGKLSATIAGAATGDIIYHNGTNWVNLPRGTNGQALYSTATSIQWDTPTINGIPIGGSTNQVLAKQSATDFDADWETLSVSSISDLTATAAELNILDGATINVTELNYLDGVTSNIQSQLGNKLSSTLAHNTMYVGNASNVASSLAAGSEGQVLTVTSGVPTWQTVSVSGVTTITALDGTTKSANGAAISSANLYLQTADDTYPGLVSTGTQTFAGAKTFTSQVTIQTTDGGPSQLWTNDGGANNEYLALYNYTDDFLLVSNKNGTGTAKSIHFGVGGGDTVVTSADMSILSGGYVGIGTTSPTATLHLKAGTATANTAPLKLTTGTALTTPEDGAMEYHSSNLYFTIGSTRYKLNGLVGSTGSTDNAVLRADGTGGLTAQSTGITIDDSDYLVLPSTGRIGVGGAPSYPIDVTGGSNPTIAARTTGTGSPGVYMQRTGGTASTSYFYIPPAVDSLRLQQNGTDYFHFANGNLGIGAYPSHPLDIQQSSASNITARVSNSSTGAVQLVLERTGGTAGSWSLVRPSGSTSLVFNDGTTDEFTFANTGTATGTDWVATSDARLKENVKNIDFDVIKKISEIGALVCEYDRTDNGRHETGFIAQELLKVAPEYVIIPEDPEQMMAVNYSKMVALLFKGFQQLLEK